MDAVDIGIPRSKVDRSKEDLEVNTFELSTMHGGQRDGSHQELGADEFRLAILQDGEVHGMQANC